MSMLSLVPSFHSTCEQIFKICGNAPLVIRMRFLDDGLFASRRPRPVACELLNLLDRQSQHQLDLRPASHRRDPPRNPLSIFAAAIQAKIHNPSSRCRGSSTVNGSRTGRGEPPKTAASLATCWVGETLAAFLHYWRNQDSSSLISFSGDGPRRS